MSYASFKRASPARIAWPSPNCLWLEGPAAAEIVVIHGGKVVVDERICMDHLQRHGEALDVGDLAAEHLRHREHQRGTDALAAVFQRIAHARIQHGRGGSAPPAYNAPAPLQRRRGTVPSFVENFVSIQLLDAASTVLYSSIVIVIGPTPPGTGVMYEALSFTFS